MEPPPESAEAQPRPKVVTLTRRQRLLLRLPTLVFKLWRRTLRIEVDPEIRRQLAEHSGPLLAVHWHNTIVAAGAVHHRWRHRTNRMAALVSASRDGAWLAGWLELNGIRPVRGSSSRRGVTALRESVQAVQEGFDLGITADGPRGPRYTFHPGAVLIARKMRCPVLLCGFRHAHARQLKSWDGFFLPRPFSRIDLNALWIDDLAEVPGLATREDERAYLERELRRLSPADPTA